MITALRPTVAWIRSALSTEATCTPTAKDQLLRAAGKQDLLAVTVAGQASAAGTAIGGGTEVLLINNDVKTSVGDSAVLTATEEDVEILAESQSDIMLVAASVSGAADKTAAGGTFAVIVTGNSTLAEVGESARLQAGQNIRLSAESREDMFNILASASGSANASGAAGVVGVLVTESKTGAKVGKAASLIAAEGSVEVLADGDVQMLTAFGTMAGGLGSAAIGATVNVNVFDNEITALVDPDAYLEAQGQTAGSNILVSATGNNESILVSFAASAGKDLALSGVISTVVGESLVKAYVDDGSYLEAGDSIGVYAGLTQNLYDIAGNISASSQNSVGATVSTLVLENEIIAGLGDGVTAIAYAAPSGGVTLGSKGQKRRGVIVQAEADAMQLLMSVGGSVGGKAGASGLVNTTVTGNTVRATVGTGGEIIAGFETPADSSDGEGEPSGSGSSEDDPASRWANASLSGADAEVAVEAINRGELYNFAGGISIGFTAGVGAAVVVMVYDSTVEASIGEGSYIKASGDVNVLADSRDEAYLLALNFSVGGKAAVSVGANVQVFQTKVTASAGGTMDVMGGVNVLAYNDVELFNIAAAVAASGTAAVSPVAVVTYFQGETLASLAADTDITALGAVVVNADSYEFITLDVAGFAASGTASVSGAVSVLVSKAKTQAYSLRGANISAGSLAVTAKDTYELIGVAVTLSGSGTAGVAVTAVVSVLKNEVLAVIGYEPEASDAAAGVITTTSGDVLVKAESVWDVINGAGSVAAGGSAGVATTIMVVVAGGKLPQDAHDSLELREEGEAAVGDGPQAWAFDPAGFIGEAFDSTNGQADSYEAVFADLGDQLAGDGVRQSETQVGTQEEVPDAFSEDGTKTESRFDAETGYVSGDFSDSKFADGSDLTGDLKTDAASGSEADGAGDVSAERGEDFQVDPSQNKDITDAGQLGPQVVDGSSEDQVKAYIGRDVVVNAAADVIVLADSLTNADLITASLSAGGYAAVSPGVAVAVLFTNVDASIKDGAQIRAEGDVLIEAVSRSAEIAEETEVSDDKDDFYSEANRNNALEEALKSDTLSTDEINKIENQEERSYYTALLKAMDIDLSKRSIRALSVTGAGGFVGVGVSVAVVVLGNTTRAVLEGDVLQAGTLTVRARNEYPLTLAATLSASGGAVAVNASVAVAANTGKVETGILGNAVIENVKNIEVLTNLKLDASSFASALGGGAAAVNAAVALAINRLESVSHIGDDVVIGRAPSGSDAGDASLESLVMNTSSETTARAVLISGAAGAAAFSTGAAVAIVEPKVYTILGCLEDSEVAGGSVYAPNAVIDIDSLVQSTAVSTALSLAAGALAAGGQILLVFNDSDAKAGLVRMPATVKSVDITAILKAEAMSFLGSANLGAQAIGVTVSYIGLDANNEAILDLRGVTLTATEGVSVSAGTMENQSEAYARAVAVAANVGALSAGVNVAIADNNSCNIARILGDTGSALNAGGKLAVLAYGQSTAQAVVFGVTAGAAAVAASVSVAVLRGAQEARVSGGSLSIKDLTAESHLNRRFDSDGRDVTGDEQKDTAQAKLYTGTIAMFEAAANIAVAYGRSSSVAEVAPDALLLEGDAAVGSYGNAGTTAYIVNLQSPVSAVSINAMLGAAFAQAQFLATLLLPAGSESPAAGDIAVTVDYLSRAVADVTPSAAGVKAGVGSLAANIAIAVAKSSAIAKLGGTGSATVDSVTVKANGQSYAEAVIRAPIVSIEIKKINLVANVLVAKLRSGQEALIENVDLTLRNAGAVTVLSALNEGRTVAANAVLGEMFIQEAFPEGTEPFKLEASLVSVKANVAVALANAVSQARILGATITAAGVVSAESKGVTIAHAKTNKGNGSVTAASIGVNVLVAEARGRFDAIVDSTGGAISARSLHIQSIYTTDAIAEGAVPSYGVSVDVSLLDIQANVALAATSTSAEASLKGSGSVTLTAATEEDVTSGGDLVVLADGTADAYAVIPGTTLSISGAKLTANVVQAVVGGRQQAFVEGVTLTADSASVRSLFNDETDKIHGAESSVGYTAGDKVEISVAKVTVNITEAAIKAQVLAEFAAQEATIAGALAVAVQGGSYATAGVDSANFSLSLAEVLATDLDAEAAGSFTANIGDGSIQAGTTTVTADVVVDAQAETAQPNASVSGLSLKVNDVAALASAQVNATASGTGKLTTGSLTMTGNTTATADAKMGGGEFTLEAINLALTTVSATVAAQQVVGVYSDDESRGYLGKDILVKNGAANITANFNYETQEDSLGNKSRQDIGATAVMAAPEAESSVNISLLSADVNTVSAVVSGGSRALFHSGSAHINGSLNISNNALAFADAHVDAASFSLGIAKLNTTEVTALAGGSFDAGMKTNGTVNLNQNANISNTYESRATAVGAAPNADISGVNVQVNTATAQTTTAADAYLSGSGTINASGRNLTVQVKGRSTAEAELAGTEISLSGIQVGVNKATAINSAVQRAFAESDGGALTVKASKLTVNSQFNEAESWKILDPADESQIKTLTIVPTAASATVGSNGSEKGIDISLVGGKESVADSQSVATGLAYIQGVNTVLSGALALSSKGESRAVSDVVKADSVSLINVSVMKTTSDAAGTFESYIDTTDAAVQAGSVAVNTNYRVNASSTVSAAGGVKVSLVSGDVNAAISNVQVNAQAYVKGSGSLRAGSLTVKTNGAITSKALAESAKVGVSGLSLAYNAASANANAAQSAYVDHSGVIELTGEAQVESLVTSSEAVATVGSVGREDGKDYDISLAGASSHVARARSVLSNIAYIQGGGTLKAGSLTLRAQGTDSSAEAESNSGGEINLVSAGNLEAYAITGETIHAYLGEGEVIVGGNLTVEAKGDTSAYAKGASPGTITLVDTSKSIVEAYVGQSGKAQSVLAELAENARLQVGGELFVNADNQGEAEAEMKDKTKFSLAKVDESSIPTKSYYNTEVRVSKGVKATAGSIRLTTNDMVRATSIIDTESVSIGFNASKMYGNNYIKVTNLISIAGDAELFAANDLDMRTASSAIMAARTYSGGKGGFYSGSEILAKNELDRTVTIRVKDGAKLEADFGNLKLEAKAGELDSIITSSKATNGAFAAVGKAKAVADVDSRAYVEIERGAELKNTFGTMSLWADSTLQYLSSYSWAIGKGFGTGVHGVTENTVKLYSEVKLGASGGSDPAVLEARYVDIQARMSELKVYAESEAEGTAAGVDSDAKAQSTVDYDQKITVDKARITGHDSILLLATGEVTTGWVKDMDSVAKAIAQGAAGDATAKTYIKGSSDSQVDVQDEAVFIGANVRIDTEDYDGYHGVWASTKRAGIVSSDDGTEEDEFYDSNGNATSKIAGDVDIDADALFYLGDAAGGILIDISDEAGVRAVGLPKEAVERFVTLSGNTYEIKELSNNLPGRLEAPVALDGNIIYNQRFIGDVVITNRTNRNLVLNGVDQENLSFGNPTLDVINGKVLKSEYTIKDREGYPTVTVINRQSGNVTVAGPIYAENSTVSFIWEGETGGSLYSREQALDQSELYVNGEASGFITAATVMAHELVVKNAVNIGYSANDRFHVFLFNTLDAAGKVSAEGVLDLSFSGDIYAAFTPAELVLVDELPEAEPAPYAGREINLRLDNIEGHGVTDLLAQQGMRIYRLRSGDIVNLTLPGMVAFLDDELCVIGNQAVLDMEAMERYLYSTNGAENTKTYLLPNRMELVVDASSGKLLSLTEKVDGKKVSLSVADYVKNGNTMTLASGVTLDLLTGEITIQPGASYTALMESFSGEWLLKCLNNYDWQLLPNFEISYEYVLNGTTVTKTSKGYTDSGITQIINGETIQYYWLKNLGPADVDVLVGEPLYYLALNTTTDSLRLLKANLRTATAEERDGLEASFQLYYRRSDPGNDFIEKYTNTDYYSYITTTGGLFSNTTGSKRLSTGSAKDCVAYYLPSTDETGNHIVKDIILFANFNMQSANFAKTMYFYLDEGTPVSMVLEQAYRIEEKTLTDDEGQTVTTTNRYWQAYRYTASLVPDGEGTLTIYAANQTASNGTEPKALNLTIKTVTIPGRSESGYRISDTTYIGTDGKVYLSAGQSFQAVYDIANKSYKSSDVLINLQSGGNMEKLWILSGTEVMLEQLSDYLAMDVQGRYWYRESAEAGDARNFWTRVESETKDGVLYVYGLFSDEDGNIERRELMQVYTEDGVTYHRFLYGVGDSPVTIGSDGSVVSDGKQNIILRRAFLGEGQTVELGTVQGEEVSITLEEPGAVLIPDEGVNIIADQAEIISSEAELGSEDSPITVAPYTEGGETELSFSDNSDPTDIKDNTLSSDTYIEVEGDGVIAGEDLDGDGEPDPLVVDGATFDYSATGDVDIAIFRLTNGAELYLTARGDVRGEEIKAYIDRFGNTQAIILAGGDLSLDRLSLDDCNVVFSASSVSIYELFEITDTDDDPDNGDANDTELIQWESVNGDILVDCPVTTLEAARLWLKAPSGSVIFDETLTTELEDLNIRAGKDIVFNDTAEFRNTSATLEAGGDLRMKKAHFTGGSYQAQVGGDIRFEILEASDQNLRLAAGGSIDTTVRDGYIRYRGGSDVSDRLSLSAQGDIGDAEQALIVDTDVTLYIEKANNYYIDGVVLEGAALYQGRRPTAATGSGRDENGDIQSGELLEDGPVDTVYAALEQRLNEDVAALLLERTDRETVAGLLNTQVLTELIASGALSSEELVKLLVPVESGDDSSEGGEGEGEEPSAQPLTAEDIERLLAQGGEIAEGESESGYAQLAALLLPLLTESQTVTDDEGAETQIYTVSDEQILDCLVQAMEADTLNIDRLAELLSELITAEELAALIEKAWEQADYAGKADAAPEEPEERALNIEVGEATGAAYVTNRGDITIRQATGTLTAGAVESNFGDVTLIALNGDIEGNPEGSVAVRAENIHLSAAGSIGQGHTLLVEQSDKRVTLVANLKRPESLAEAIVAALAADGQPTDEAGKAERPKELWALETLIDFDWLLVNYPGEAVQLNATAGGDINIRENSGDMGLGVIDAGGDVSLAAPGDILDAREENESAPNLQAGGDAALTSGGEIGREDERIETDVDGTITALAQEDISIADRDDLDLVAQSEEGQVNASAEDELRLENIDGDLVVGPIEAGSLAEITAQGDLVEGERYDRDAQVEADNISLSAGGDIGTEEDPFDVDTGSENGGQLSADADYVHIQETDGDLILDRVESDGDAVIRAPEDILDGGEHKNDAAVEAQKEANQAAADAEAAETEAYVRREETKDTQEALDAAQAAQAEAEAAAQVAREAEAEAQKALDEAKEALQNIDPDAEPEAYAAQKERIAELEDALAKETETREEREEELAEAETALTEAETAHQAAEQAATEAEQRAEQLRQEAEEKQAAADKAKEEALAEDATVTTGGDLELNAGGDIGAEGEGLSVDVEGSVDANAGQNGGDDTSVNLSGRGDLDLEEITVPGHIDISTIDGDITGDTLSGDSLDVSALDGDVGEESKPLEVDVNTLDALGDEVYIHNSGDTEIGQVTGDTVVIDADGDISGRDDGKTDIIGGDVTLNADGDIGTEDDPLDTSMDSFHGSGDNIYIDNHSGDLDLSDIESDNLDVSTDGNVTGRDIVTHDIRIDAGGNVGTPEIPLTFWADGRVDIRAGLRVCHWRNLYQPAKATSVQWAWQQAATASPDFRYANESFLALLVLKLDVTVGDEELSLYVLIGLNDRDELILLGLFLGERETDEDFWTELLLILREELGIRAPGVFLIDGLEGFREAQEEIYEDSLLLDLAEEPVPEEETESERLARERCWAEETFAVYTDEPEALRELLEKLLTETLPEALEELETAEEPLTDEEVLDALSELWDEWTAAEAQSDPIRWRPSQNSGYALERLRPEA